MLCRVVQVWMTQAPRVPNEHGAGKVAMALRLKSRRRFH